MVIYSLTIILVSIPFWYTYVEQSEYLNKSLVPEPWPCVVDDTDPLSPLIKKIKYQKNIGKDKISCFIDLSGRLEVDNYHVPNLFWLQ